MIRKNIDLGLNKYGRIKDTQNLVFFQCDIQEKMADYSYNMEGVINTAIMMAKASEIFFCPLIETVHVPKVFGKTIPEIAEAQGSTLCRFEKNIFSMYTDKVKEYLD